MAMLHADDLAFAQRDDILSNEAIATVFDSHLGLSPTSIIASANQGQFHKVYFVKLSQADGHRWSGRDVVLRVARKTIVKTKTENEISLLNFLRDVVPVPEVVFFSADPTNALGYEYNCLERIPYPSLAETWKTLSTGQLDHVLDQFVDIFVKLFKSNAPPNHGSLALDGGSGPVIEETMWQLPDIDRYFHAAPYNLTSETFGTLNPTESYSSWPAYICAFLKTYHHIISIHPNVDFLRDILDPLQHVITALDVGTAPWVCRLRDESALRARLHHRDFHFGNILADEEGTIKAVIDWEFAGMGPSFPARSSLIGNCVDYLAYKGEHALDSWEDEFLARLRVRAPEIAETWVHERDRSAVLGIKGQALSNLREYLRGCLEVGVRRVGRVEMAQGAWKKVVVDSLLVLEE
ncbi:kinase-like domain-containing protein [Roridomyces roridus]|uniref:Kinase-like domain-containing protein n=1 Tax=Roridomyces roridus TaxID=1738132 RepID=A0AAD7C2B3_9AGAR|nr:kinase-like domain-containing protein [Roridomyces roridus]